MTKRIFMSIVMLATCIFLYSAWIAINQNIEYTEYGLIHITSQELIKSNPSEAIENITYLQSKDPNNYIFHLEKAKAYINLNNIESALKECKNAMEQRPVLDEDNIFMSIYGQILYLDGQIKEASNIFKKLEKIGIPEEYEEQIQKILQEIKKV